MPASALTCPQCSAALQPPPERTQFFCQFCGATVVVPEEPPTPDDEGSGLLRKPVDLSGFDIDKQGDDLTIGYTWSRGLGCFLVFFAAFWNAIVIGFGTGVTFAAMEESPIFLLGLLFLLPFIAVGLFIAYTALAHLFNRTTIAVRDRTLSVSHGPLYWKSPAPIDAAGLRQLFVFEKVNQGKERNHHTYELHALQHDGPVVKLITGQQSPDRLRAIERMLEVHLDIADRRVEDEHG